MNNMKKLLALVLALVMTMGLATVGANAALVDEGTGDVENLVVSGTTTLSGTATYTSITVKSGGTLAITGSAAKVTTDSFTAEAGSVVGFTGTSAAALTVNESATIETASFGGVGNAEGAFTTATSATVTVTAAAAAAVKAVADTATDDKIDNGTTDDPGTDEPTGDTYTLTVTGAEPFVFDSTGKAVTVTGSGTTWKVSLKEGEEVFITNTALGASAGLGFVVTGSDSDEETYYFTEGYNGGTTLYGVYVTMPGEDAALGATAAASLYPVHVRDGIAYTAAIAGNTTLEAVSEVAGDGETTYYYDKAPTTFKAIATTGTGMLLEKVASGGNEVGYVDESGMTTIKYRASTETGSWTHALGSTTGDAYFLSPAVQLTHSTGSGATVKLNGTVSVAAGKTFAVRADGNSKISAVVSKATATATTNLVEVTEGTLQYANLANKNEKTYTFAGATADVTLKVAYQITIADGVTVALGTSAAAAATGTTKMTSGYYVLKDTYVHVTNTAGTTAVDILTATDFDTNGFDEQSDITTTYSGAGQIGTTGYTTALSLAPATAVSVTGAATATINGKTTVTFGEMSEDIAAAATATTKNYYVKPGMEMTVELAAVTGATGEIKVTVGSETPVVTTGTDANTAVSVSETVGAETIAVTVGAATGA